MNEQLEMFSENPEYDAFVEKFRPKKTTDDCYTPPLIYDTVKEWACKEYGIDPESIVRPFWPGGDYENYDYPDGCTVLDNPPFSILSKICEFYLDRGIHFFLFAPSLTALSGRSVVMRMNHIICDANIVYENGAVVHTAFVTNYGGDIVIQTAPTLCDAINNAVQKLRLKKTRNLPKYSYPDNVVTAAMMQQLAHYGVDFQVRRNECAFISRMDSQKEAGKSVFGGGLLIANKKAAEKAAAHVWELSEREKKIIAELDENL